MANNSFCIYLQLEPYLRQWLLNDCGNVEPIRFHKLSIENKILETFLIPVPHNASPDLEEEDSTAIYIPEFKNKKPHVYNYLPVHAKKELKRCIRNRFIIDLWNGLNKFGHIGKKRFNLIMAWMEARGIAVDDKNFNTIVKIYQRQYKVYINSKRSSEKTKK